MNNVQFYIFGYSDYIKNSLNDIIDLPEVKYYDLYYDQSRVKRITHRIFVSKHVKVFSKLIMPFWYKTYWKDKEPSLNEIPIIVLYEINPLSNKTQWIRKIKNQYPNAKIIYIFTNIIDDHNLWRMKQILSERNLYDLVLTFNMSDAEKYNIDYYEGVFSPKTISGEIMENIEENDVYFCGLDKGRLPLLMDIYEHLEHMGIKCTFDVIFPQTIPSKEYKGIRLHSKLINNDEMLAYVQKSKCILEVMVDRSQPGSSLRMCESIVYKKKLLTNNPYVMEKPFYNKKQMLFFDSPKDINKDFIYNKLQNSDYLETSLLSPKKLLGFICNKVL